MDALSTILLIEEDNELRALIRDLMERMGYWVIAVPGAERTARVFDMATRVDLVVADVTVPDSDSIALTEEILSSRADVSGVVIATQDTELMVKRRFGKERVRFLRKPFSLDELRGAVEAALALAPLPAAVAEGGEDPLRRAGLERARAMPRHAAAWGLGMAAALVLVAGVWLRGVEPGPPPLPESAEATVLRGGSLAVVEPTGDRSQLPSHLTWQGLEDAAFYRVRILAVDDSLLWESTTRGATVTLVPEVKAMLHAGVVYFWAVEALDSEGRILARSKKARFQVIPLRGDPKGSGR